MLIEMSHGHVATLTSPFSRSQSTEDLNRFNSLFAEAFPVQNLGRHGKVGIWQECLHDGNVSQTFGYVNPFLPLRRVGCRVLDLL